MRICMASDFFYPNMGGVEEHIFNLSECLLLQGHKIIIITHSYDNRKGIRYMTNGLKVYYLPIKTCYNQCILPTMICNIPLIRYILIREQIDIVHGHSAFSALAHETMFVGKLLGLRTVFTDHSLFGFADLSAIVTNKLLEIILSTCNHCICVSHTGKENTVLRAKVPKYKISVIPNAVDTANFTPNPINRLTKDNTITIIIISRLVYRKGVDLMAGVITRLKNMKNINFIIGGDGPKRDLLEEVREKSNMQDRVTMLGALEHSKGTSIINSNNNNNLEIFNVRDVLTKGHIFLNTSLTEAYCMAIVEAASCGLQVVSTKVGGIPEVLPSNLIILTEPNIESVLNGVLLAIKRQIYHRQCNSKINTNGCSNTNYTLIRNNNNNNRITKLNKRDKVLCPFQCNKIVTNLYNWNNVTMRTEKVYRRVLNEANPSFGVKLNCYLNACVPFALVVSFCYLVLKLLDWFLPRQFIDNAREFKNSTVSSSSLASLQRPPQKTKATTNNTKSSNGTKVR